MARRARAAAADADHMDMGDDAKPRGDEGDAEVTDEDADFSPTHNHTVSGQGTRLPPVTGRQVPRTPPQVRRQGGPSHHNIATPPARANDPRSPRTRSDRRLAEPPSSGVTLDGLMAAITFSRNETTVRLDELAKTQVLQTSALEEVARHTDRLEGLATESQAATAALAARVAELDKGGSRCPFSAASEPSSAASAGGRRSDPHHADPSILRLSAQSLILKQAAEEALKPLLKAARLDAARVRVTGRAVGKAFVIRPERRDSKGEWLRLIVAGPDGAQIPVFTDLGRSTCRLAPRAGQEGAAATPPVVGRRARPLRRPPHPTIGSCCSRVGARTRIAPCPWPGRKSILISWASTPTPWRRPWPTTSRRRVPSTGAVAPAGCGMPSCTARARRSAHAGAAE